MPLSKGKRKRGLKLTLYKKRCRYKFPISPLMKRTKTFGNTPVFKYLSQKSPHIFKNSLSPIKTSTPIRRNLFTQNDEKFKTTKADLQNLLFTNIDYSHDNLEEDHNVDHVVDNEEDIEEDHVVDHIEDLEELYKVFQSALDKLSVAEKIAQKNVLMFDDKKVRKWGDVDLLGFEDGQSLQDRKEIHANEIKAISKLVELIRNINRIDPFVKNTQLHERLLKKCFEKISSNIWKLREFKK
ncbi:unnamed protein product [Mytilus coruscus]|uniref:Uncharacterized protein n=1 Tax=Mytilus coruscus TaxID=42192 RepID=A0A6J8BVM3_MYTCO|nr:unnamed protein product [Mytilus coruscus]